MALSVANLDGERALVVRGGIGLAFIPLPPPDGSTRLVVRERYVYLTGWALVEPVELVSVLMTEWMLRGIGIVRSGGRRLSRATVRLCDRGSHRRRAGN